MLNRFSVCLPLVLLALLGSALAESPTIEVHFSPKGGCTDAIIGELAAAKSSVLVQAYSFTSAPIAKALIDANKRGVKVWVVLDKSQQTEKYSEADFFVHLGIPVRIDSKHAIAHNKVMVIDGGIVITGSFNFTKAAEESNAENLLVIRDTALAGKYADNFKEHARHSETYQAKEKGVSELQPQPKPQAQPVPVASGDFVASKKSKVFHRPDCKYVDKISDANLVHYETREEAVKSGKRPCTVCEP